MREEAAKSVDTGGMGKLEALGAQMYHKHLLSVRLEGSSHEQMALVGLRFFKILKKNLHLRIYLLI